MPWPLSSVASLSLLTKSLPGSRRPARSGSAVTPVSITATVTDDEPVVESQAAFTLVLAMPHWSAYAGSSGVTVVMCAMWSGST